MLLSASEMTDIVSWGIKLYWLAPFDWRQL